MKTKILFAKGKFTSLCYTALSWFDIKKSPHYILAVMPAMPLQFVALPTMLKKVAAAIATASVGSLLKRRALGWGFLTTLLCVLAHPAFAATTYAITPNPATVSENVGTLTFTITRSGGTPAETIYVSTTVSTEGYANDGDYTGIHNQTVSFTSGQVSRTVTVTINDDSTVEGSERFGFIAQRNSTDPVTTYLAKSTFTINDNDAPPPTTYAITPNPATVSENVGTLTFTITRSGGTPAETIYVSTTVSTEGYANDGDYTGIHNQTVSFTSGQASRTVTVTINDDSTVEGSERFGFIAQRNSTDPVTTYLAKSTFTITDNDVQPTTYAITPNPATVSENVGTLTFTITRSGGTPAETIYVSTTVSTEGYANDGDYTGIHNQTVSFTSGQASRTVTVTINDDSTVEGSERFGFIAQRNSTDPVTTYLAKSTFTITDNDVQPTTYAITPNPATVNENVGSLTFTITRSGGTPAETIYVSTTVSTEGYANDGDYTGIHNQTVSFTSGQASRTVTVTINDDSTVEGSERFGFIAQRNSTDPVTTYLAKSTFTITDNDVQPTTYAITPNPATVNEDVGSLTFTITRSGGTPAETIYVSTTVSTEGYANNGDYTGILNQTVSFTSGQVSRTVTVTINDDTTVESDERFGFIAQRNSTDPVTTYLAKSTFTITDNDVQPTTYAITPNPATVNEDVGSLTFTITRSGGTPAETIYVSTTVSTEGYANDGDYTGIHNQTVSFTSGQVSRTVTVTINDDSTVESDERFGFIAQRNSTDPVLTYLAKSTFTITDNDEQPTTTYAITPNPATVSEGAGTLTFTITRSGGTPAETIYVSTTVSTEGYANNGDYTGIHNQTVSFTDGQTTRTVTVTINNDTTTENSERFGFIAQRNSTDPVTTYLAKSTFTIIDNDVQPTITSVSPNPVTGSASAQPFTINGNNFASGCSVTLRDRTTAEVFPNRPISSFSGSQIIINPNFTIAAHNWSVEVINPGGVSSGQYNFAVVAPGGGFYLSFPLPNRTPYAAIINSVFDHARAPGVVIAFTGEKGEEQYGRFENSFKQANGNDFSVTGNGNYSGSHSPDFLTYDDHLGFDFRTRDQDPVNGRINVLAAAPGVVHWIIGSDYNTIEIDHGNGYTTRYLHLYTRQAGLDGVTVTRGQVIGISGDIGATGSPHLHFEVRLSGVAVDPYGWSGVGTDPYKTATGVESVNLWNETAGCTYLISPVSRSHGPTADSGAFPVSAGAGCAWTATPTAAWITITSGNSGSGNGTVTYSVSANTGNGIRTGTINVQGTAFTISQAGVVAGDRIYGVDVSSVGQGTITPAQWTQVKTSGKSFVWIRASKGNADSDGNCRFLDSKFYNNINNAKAAGLVAGAYHVGNVVQDSAVEEAAFFVSVAGDYIKPGHLRPVLDLESHSCGDPASLGASALSTWVDQWATEVQRLTGVTPIIYCNQSFLANLQSSVAQKYDLWVAKFTENPESSVSVAPWSDWTTFQYSQSGSVGGISPIDLNVFRGTLAEFQDRLVIPMPQIVGVGGGGIQPPSNGQFQFEVSAPSQQQVIMQASDDLVTWTDVGAVIIVNGTAIFTDSDANAHPKRFYRPKP